MPPGVRARRGRRRLQREGGLDPAARRVHRRRQPALVAGQRHGAAPSRQREQGFVRLAAAAGALHSLSPLSSLLSPLPSPLSPLSSLLSSLVSKARQCRQFGCPESVAWKTCKAKQARAHMLFVVCCFVCCLLFVVCCVHFRILGNLVLLGVSSFVTATRA